MVIASIDLMNGRAVQLRRGRDKILQRDDVIPLARRFHLYGEVAVIDLDAAMGRGNNAALIQQLLREAECRVGGGIRSTEEAVKLVAQGAVKIIIGSKAFENDVINKHFLSGLVKRLGRERIVIAIDAIRGEVVTRAWAHRTGLKVTDIVPTLTPYCGEFLFTSVEREGMMQGPDMDRLRELRSITPHPLTLAGGITTIVELEECARLGVDVQLGMALYTGKLALDDAFIASLKWQDQLIPTIVQDQTGQVLMCAYSSKESLRKTFETGTMWYYSRSRERLWNKGETSGNTQQVVSMRADCDRDTVLATVEQTRYACHQGRYSCFGDKKFSLKGLFDVVAERCASRDPCSYTATLTEEKLNKKLSEEMEELINTSRSDEVVWEVADVLYFLSVKCAQNKITLQDILHELRRRHYDH